MEVRETPLQTEEGAFVLAAVVDITERERSERELREAAAQLQTANDDLTKTEAELKILCAEGCDEIQGFLISQAVSSDRFAALLRREATGEADPTPALTGAAS